MNLSPQPQQPSQPQPQQPSRPQRQRQQRIRKLPLSDLLQGPRVDYLNTVVPLYDASIKCNWESAKAILDQKPHLVRYSITEHHDTPLHVAASAKADPTKVKSFVENLVNMMEIEDLELQNKNSNTALYLAAVAGEVETVKIMLNKNRGLLKIPGGKGTPMMPLYAAALFGNYDVVKCIYEETPNLSEEDGWDPESRQWLLEKCVENDMFVVALKMVEKHNELACSQEVLGILARKREAFEETKSNIIVRITKSAFECFGKKMGAPEKESALPLLRFMWDIILQEPKARIDEILRGPADSYNRDNKRVSGWAVQAFQLKEVIRAFVERSGTKPGSTSQGTKPIPISNEEVVNEHLQELSKLLMNMHVATQTIVNNYSNLVRDDNKPISNMEILAMELQNLIFKYIADMNEYSMEMSKQTGVQADELKESISMRIQEFNNESNAKVKRFAKKTYSSRVLFLAAEAGNTTFLVELIRRNPDLIWKVDDNGLSIFHVAARHRHEGIYNILYEIGAMKDLITPLKDRKDNNMLHLVGKIAQQKRLEDVSGVALQMQLELLWFNEVKKMIPATYRETENADGLTPHELFTKEHKDLVTQGEKWMKDTASQCMVVAALIATIVFAATFTVPGGYCWENRSRRFPNNTANEHR